MNDAPTPTPHSASQNEPNRSGDTGYDPYDGVNLQELFARLRRGMLETIGLAVLGSAIAAIAYFASSPFTSAVTTMRVAFSFEGYGKGENPDHSKFEADDIRAPNIILEALKRQGLDSSATMQSGVRAALTIEALIPANVIKERDRLRSAGQMPGLFVPDEYLLTLAIPRNFPITIRQRELLLDEIVNVYREHFRRTYADVPASFGNAFGALHSADFFAYELILNSEMRNITTYLNQELDRAKTFRSPTTNLSYGDLLEEAELFSKVKLNEILGLIQQNGLSLDRTVALVKMNYYLHTLVDRENEAVEQEKVVDDLLAKTQARSQDYVLGIKNEATQQHSNSPILDEGLIDSLVANDAYNFLIRRALDAGLNVRRIHAEKAQLLEWRASIEDASKNPSNQNAEIVARVQKSLNELEVSYNELISNIRETDADFVQQEFADAVRIATPASSGGRYKAAAMAAIAGSMLGFALGIGLSLLGIYIGRKVLL